MNEENVSHAESDTREDVITSSKPSPGAMRLAMPLVIGYLPVACAFGVLGAVVHLPIWAIIGMSVLVYGGASQFAALPLIATGNVTSIILTTFIINLRHVLLAASIAPRLSGMGTLRKSLFSVQLTDEAFAVHDAEYRHRPSRPHREVFGMNILVHISWVVGTLAGVVFGGLVPNLESLGLDFALTAMFIGILVIEVLDSRHECLVGLIGGACAVATTLLGADIWSTLIATTLAATVGWVRQERKEGMKA